MVELASVWINKYTQSSADYSYIIHYYAFTAGNNHNQQKKLMWKLPVGKYQHLCDHRKIIVGNTCWKMSIIFRSVISF